MEVKSRLIDYSYSLDGHQRLTFELDEKRGINALMESDVRLRVEKWRQKRSLQANRLMWACIGKLADAMRSDKDTIHDLMLSRYGAFTYQIIKPAALERLQLVWEGIVEDKGEIYVDGVQGRQVLMIYPSRYYDTKEFSRLLDGIISEMKECGLETPEEEDFRLAMEEYERLKPWESQSSKKKDTATAVG